MEVYMKFIIYLLNFCLFLSILFGYNKKYDPVFQSLGRRASNQILQALDSTDLDMICSALKRVGEIQLKEALPKVKNLIGMANPSSFSGKESLKASYKDIFIIGIWALGRIGDEKDAEIIASYFKDAKDKEVQLNIIKALGELTNSIVAINELNNITTKITDERLANVLLDSILKHNSKSSILFLLKMQSKNSFSKDFNNRINEAIINLTKYGKEEEIETNK